MIHRPARLAVVLSCLVGVLAASGCAPAGGLRTESPLASSSSAVELAPSATVPEDQWDTPFGQEQVRKTLLRTDLAPLRGQGADVGQIREDLRQCGGKCLAASPPHTVDGHRLQLWTLTSIADGWGYAAFAIADHDGAPQVQLMVAGQNIGLLGGNGGTLVAQESVYGPDDPLCCPTGWRSRIYRWQDGAFVGGDVISGTVEPTP